MKLDLASGLALDVSIKNFNVVLIFLLREIFPSRVKGKILMECEEH